MRLRIDAIVLGDTSRRVTFESGLNIITGPIASGKTTLFRFIRSIVGGSLDNLTPEARTIRSLLGEIVVGDIAYSIVRPNVSTPTARVDIASKNMAARLPISQLDSESSQTYLQWLLERLNLGFICIWLFPSFSNAILLFKRGCSMINCLLPLLKRVVGRLFRMVADSFTTLGAILIPLGYVLRLEFGKSWEFTAMVILGLVMLTFGFFKALRTEKKETDQRLEEYKISNNRFLLLKGTLESILEELQKLNKRNNENEQ